LISVARIFTVYKKDIYWVLGNFKLLGIMLVPVLFIVLFSKAGKGALFPFIMVFINAFVGIFSTSYLIIEEKNKGTLLSLLTTPLKSYELLLAKFLFNLTLCLLISTLAIAINQRWDLLLSPMALINVVLYAGLTCFFGCIVGVFFKNEQEMSVVAPLLMFFFLFGDLMGKTSANFAGFMAFFPDYHITQVIKNPVSGEVSLMSHTVFNFIYFALALIMATLYTQFYFSNHRETRFSKTLPLMLAVFFVALTASAFIHKDTSVTQVDMQGRVSQRFLSPYWSGRFEYDSNKWELKRIMDTAKVTLYVLNPVQAFSGEVEISLAFRDAEANESSFRQRRQYILGQSNKKILAKETFLFKTHDFQKFIYLYDDKLIFLHESFCGDQLLQISMDLNKEALPQLNEILPDWHFLLENLSITCSQHR
jgi:ABC-2 type transport system permease protein